MAWSSPRCLPGPAADFWGFPCPFPAGSSQGKPLGPLPTRSKTDLPSFPWAGIAAATLRGYQRVPPNLCGGERVRALGKSPLAGQEEEEDDGVGRTGEAGFAKESGGVLSPPCPGCGASAFSPDLPDWSHRSRLRGCPGGTGAALKTHGSAGVMPERSRCAPRGFSPLEKRGFFGKNRAEGGSSEVSPRSAAFLSLQRGSAHALSAEGEGLCGA